MFVDEAKIIVQAGQGGNGSASFRREKCVPFGGPDGGDGGRGGSVVFVADEGVNTLVELKYKRIIQAPNGDGGRGAQCYGRKGDDIIIKVPIGTLVYFDDTGELMGDLSHHEQCLVVAKGGSGGLGNIHFKTSTNQAPKRVTPGQPGERFDLRLELKLLAHVGLVGFPNAGKSTLIRQMSAAKPKVANYPFTTLIPNLGVVRIDSETSFVIADIPGLIEGAAEGAGLGHQFLRHVSRCSVLLYVLDCEPIGEQHSIKEAFDILQSELARYDDRLSHKQAWIVVNQIDKWPEDLRETLKAELEASLESDMPVRYISGQTGENVTDLARALAHALAQEDIDA